MDEKLTPRQEQIYNYIKEHIKKHGFPPTIRDIGRRFNIKSTNGVNIHLKELIRKGYIKKVPHRSRSIVILEPSGKPRGEGESVAPVPVVGVVKAGKPIFAFENISEQILIDSSLIGKSSEIFILKISGDSMIGDGILDGDLIFVSKQNYASDGDIVVAMIGEEATVKRFFKEKDRIVLKSSNPAMPPIEVEGERKSEFRIVGKVVGVFRKY